MFVGETWKDNHRGVMSTHELTTLYQLCRLGIPGPVLVSTLFEDLRATIRCAAMTLLWQPARSPVARWYYESESELNCGVVSRQSFSSIFAASPQADTLTLLENEPLLSRHIADALPSISHTFEQSAGDLVLHLVHSGKRIGAMLLHRRDTESFSTAEKAALVRWSSTLSSALDLDTNTCHFVTSEASAGILLLDSQMKIQSACCRGRKLMQLSEAPDCKGSGGYCDGGVRHALQANFGSKSTPGVSNFVVRNGWGRFQFRLHALVDSDFHSDRLTAVAVHLQEPLPLSVLRRAKDLALTVKQTEICLLLIKGLSYGAVAKQLSISSTTVVDHMRKVYEKVGVGSRSELVAMLLLGEQGGGERRGLA